MVSARWLETCLHAGNLLPPDSSQFIRTLPAKVGSNVTDFGVALQSALIHLGTTPQPLQSCFIYLCGKFQRQLEGDILLLARESGATIIKQRKAAISMAESDQGRLVLLCKDDSDSSFNSSLETAVRNHPQKVSVVTFQWLFDSVSGVEFQDARSYPPEGVLSRALWKLTTDESHNGTGGYFGTTSL